MLAFHLHPLHKYTLNIRLNECLFAEVCRRPTRNKQGERGREKVSKRASPFESAHIHMHIYTHVYIYAIYIHICSPYPLQ